jgi:hypothetical protein
LLNLPTTSISAVPEEDPQLVDRDTAGGKGFVDLLAKMDQIYGLAEGLLQSYRKLEPIIKREIAQLHQRVEQLEGRAGFIPATRQKGG